MAETNLKPGDVVLGTALLHNGSREQVTAVVSGTIEDIYAILLEEFQNTGDILFCRIESDNEVQVIVDEFLGDEDYLDVQAIRQRLYGYVFPQEEDNTDSSRSHAPR